jgi:hypothetical protein
MTGEGVHGFQMSSGILRSTPDTALSVYLIEMLETLEVFLFFCFYVRIGMLLR